MGALGEWLPPHLHGRCGFDPSLSGNICGEPAVWHFVAADESAPTGWCRVQACERHAGVARRVSGAVDWHVYEGPCLTPGAHWQFSTAARPGFCFSPDEETSLQSELHEGVTV